MENSLILNFSSRGKVVNGHGIVEYGFPYRATGLSNKERILMTSVLIFTS